MLVPLDFSPAPLKITRSNDRLYVLCPIRRKKIMLTPEEWVRQHVLYYLLDDRAFPQSLVVSEISLQINGLNRRCDIACYDRNGNPLVIVECKAPEVNITDKALHQIAQYNAALKARFLMLTNGKQHFFCEVDQHSGEIQKLSNLPHWEELSL